MCTCIYLPLILLCLIFNITLWNHSLYGKGRSKFSELVPNPLVFIIKQYTIKVYHWGSQQDSSSPRASLFPEACSRGTVILLTPSIYTLNVFLFQYKKIINQKKSKIIITGTHHYFLSFANSNWFPDYLIN